MSMRLIVLILSGIFSLFLSNCSSNVFNSNTEIKLGAYENEKFSCGDIFEYLCYRLERRFQKRDCEIFYKTFGINGYDDMQCQEIAKEYNVSNGLISQKIKKMIEFIRKDEDLCEMLGQLLEK